MSFDADSVIQRTWRGLPEDAPRELWFRALRDAIRESYLSEPGNPYRASGRSRGAARWLETRRLLADGIDRDGHYMDVGCANGLLLESLVGWAAEDGHVVVPHGIDLVPELVVLAQERHENYPRHFTEANALDWDPPPPVRLRPDQHGVRPRGRSRGHGPTLAQVRCRDRRHARSLPLSKPRRAGPGHRCVRPELGPTGRATRQLPGVDVAWIRKTAAPRNTASGWLLHHRNDPPHH